MKYIRTKDGRIINLIRYKLINENEQCLKYEYILNKGIMFINKENILKQADTIEELCDEFVLIRNDLHLNERTSNLKYAKGMAKQGFIVYGAIWTKKGLIYVAKMNDKGELELL